MKKMLLIILLVFIVASSAQAVPVLQVGAPADPSAGDSGIYADYIGSLTDPFEADTALTSGGTLYVAGAYNQNVEWLGGKCGVTCPSSDGWSDFDFNSFFYGSGAILMATVPDGSLSGAWSLTVDSNVEIYSADNLDAFSDLSNDLINHAPVKDQDYLFFDIEHFAKTVLIPDFSDESVSNTYGEIKTLEIATSGFDWIHFDVFALMTKIDPQSGKSSSTFTSTFKSTVVDNPGSHDVTWKQIPEPSTMILLGSSLIGLAIFRKKFRI